MCIYGSGILTQRGEGCENCGQSSADTMQRDFLEERFQTWQSAEPAVVRRRRRVVSAFFTLTPIRLPSSAGLVAGASALLPPEVAIHCRHWTTRLRCGTRWLVWSPMYTRDDFTLGLLQDLHLL
jgi:hypothetical protein